MMEKQKLLEQQYIEQMVYAELYNRDIKKKERDEIEKLTKIKEKVDERNQILALQKTLNDEKRTHEVQRDQLEKEMLN